MINLEKFKTSEEAIFALSNQLLDLINLREEKYFNLAISGGKTAQLMFKIWRKNFATKIDWCALRFFWVDERMLTSASNESNFGNANRMLFEPLKISKEQIFKINGTQEADAEARRYEREVTNALEDFDKKCGADTSQFDLTILGVGKDAHIASIFPNQKNIFTTNSMYVATKHPQNGQLRITMTSSAILNSHRIFILVLGEEKKQILKKVLQDVAQKEPQLPASNIIKNASDVSIFTNSI